MYTVIAVSAVAKGLSSVIGVLVILNNHIESVSGLIINVCPDLTVYAFHKNRCFVWKDLGHFQCL